MDCKFVAKFPFLTQLSFTMKNQYFTTLIIVCICLLNLQHAYAQYVFGGASTVQSPNVMGFGGIGVTGNSWNNTEAVYVNPARITQGERFAAQFSYSPSFNNPMSMHRFFSVNAGYAFESGHALGITSRKRVFKGITGGGIVLGPASVNMYSLAYRYETKKRFSVGLSLGYHDEPNQVWMSGLTASLGIHKAYQSEIKPSGYGQFTWGLSFADIGGARHEDKSDVNGRRAVPSSQFYLGLGYQRKIFFDPEGDSFLDIMLAYQAQKSIVPQLVTMPGLIEGGILTRIFNSLSDNPEGFSGELAEIRHHTGLLVGIRMHNFTGNLSFGYMPGVSTTGYFGSSISSFGVSIGYKAFNISAARQQYSGFTNLTYADFLQCGYSIPLE